MLCGGRHMKGLSYCEENWTSDLSEEMHAPSGGNIRGRFVIDNILQRLLEAALEVLDANPQQALCQQNCDGDRSLCLTPMTRPLRPGEGLHDRKPYTSCHHDSPHADDFADIYLICHPPALCRR